MLNSFFNNNSETNNVTLKSYQEFLLNLYQLKVVLTPESGTSWDGELNDIYPKFLETLGL